ncbi:octopamine receptor 1 [Nematostella vectensis]|uniref:octopamine receptor 1 n=1 Tax=Nematostella vectensis TaxID=45351 RepID=UPI00207776DF|nr:octopamine receptor 1 [Nematostella vectensis]XP_032221811.2 octopamine receptor 1 [Nematostella vectensis]XP_032221812.2 octopamine receptor 1 [Nematostella vectensis]
MTNNSSNPSHLFPNFPRLPNDEIETIASSVFYIILALLIIGGNSLVIAAYRSNPRLQTVTNSFLVGLAVSDLLVGLVSIPLWLYFSICQYYGPCTQNVGLKIFYPTVDVFCGSASVLQLTAISVERCIALTQPIRHRTHSPRFYHAMIVMAWLIAFILAGLYPFQVERWQKAYTAVLAIVSYGLPILIIIVLYAIIYSTSRKESRKWVNPEGIPRRVTHQGTKIAVTIAVITCLLVIAWLPFFVVNIIATFCSYKALPPYPALLRLVRFVKWMHYSNSFMNPCVYAYRNIEMRRTFQRILPPLLSCCCAPYPPQYSTSLGLIRRQFNVISGNPGNVNPGFHGDQGEAQEGINREHAGKGGVVIRAVVSPPTRLNPVQLSFATQLDV